MSSSPTDNPVTGLVRKYHSNFYYVEVDGVLYECSLRGMIKKEGAEVLVGDRVSLDSLEPERRAARISGVLPRKNAITRPKLANVDQVFVLYSLREPLFDPNQMDRYLTHIELAGLLPVICVSKADLVEDAAERLALQSLYRDKLGFEVLFTSVHNPDSLQPIEGLVRDRITVLAGPSGAGKSSLLNALNPDLRLRVGEVSEKIARGQHTTRHVELVSLHAGDEKTLIADTPGFSHLKFNYVLPGRIEAVYRDFAPYRDDCAFSDCLHLDEEGCAVLANLDHIPASRYESYRAMMEEARQYKEESQATSQKQEYGYKEVSRKGKESVRILRLKEKNRDASRRTVKQQVSLLEAEAGETDGDDPETGDFLVDDPPDSV